MAEDILDIILRLSNLQRFVAGTREAAGGIASVGDASKRSSEKSAAASGRMVGAAGLMSKAMKGTAVAAAGIAFESTKMSIEFDKQMEMIHTQAGARQAEVVRQSKNILSMTKTGQFAQGPTELAKGLFHIESISPLLRGKKALDALKIAAQGAAIGGADLEQTTTALGAAWLVNIRGGNSIKTVMAALNATVGAGNIRMQSLVDSLGTGVLPASKLAGLGLRDVMSALAILSDEGYHGYSAMAQFATSLHFITGPGKKAADALGAIRLQQYQLADTLRKHGLIAALTQLHDHLVKFGGNKTHQNAILGNILPAGRGRVLETLINQIDRLHLKDKQIAANMKNWADDVAKTHQTAAFKIHAAWSGIQSDMITLGHVLQPVAVLFAQGVQKMADGLLAIPHGIQDVIKWFNKLGAGGGQGGKFVNSLRADANHLGHDFTRVAHAVIGAINSIGQAAGQIFNRQFRDDLLVIGRAIAGFASTVGRFFLGVAHSAIPGIVMAFKGGFNIIAGVVNFVANLLQFRFAKAFGALGQIFRGAVQFLGGVFLTLSAPIRTVGAFIWSIIHGAFSKVLGFVKGVPGSIAGFFSGLAGTISGIFSGVVNGIIDALNFVINAVNGVISGYNSVAGSIPLLGGGLTIGKIGTIGHIGGAATPSPPGPAPKSTIKGKSGGATPRGVASRQFAMAGTRSPVRAAVGAGSLPDVVVPVSIDGKEVARATGKFVGGKRARR